MTPHILLKFASRSRPEKFFKTLDNIYSRIADKENFSIICSLDEDDKSMTDHFKSVEAFQAFGKKYPNTKVYFGVSKNKIDAINRDINKAEKQWDILVNVSDDMEFIVDGFDNVIRESFLIKIDFTGFDNAPIYPYNRDQCIHFPDGNHKSIITMSILGRDYFNRDRYIYNPMYTSLWSDNEQTLVAMMRGCYKYIDTQIFSHNHPAFGKGTTDAQYKHTESYFYIDKDVFDLRKSRNFDLPETFKLPTFYPNSNTAI